MTSILKVDNIYNEAGSSVAYTQYLARRVVQRVEYTHRVGWWYPNDTYHWIPGGYLDFTPVRNDTRVRIVINIPTTWYGNVHSITHWIFYRDEIEYGRHCRGGYHNQDTFAQEWDVPSWGEGHMARLGYKARSYANGNHSAHLYYETYWDGGGVGWHMKGQIFAEEYFPIS